MLMKKNNQTVIAVGGGKGGTGKSFMLSSTGSSLAMQGKRVLMIDADMGSANLHSFFGLNRPRLSLTDFFENKIPLELIASETSLPNLRLIPGDIKSLRSRVTFSQKMKFLRHVRSINTDYVFIDLGAGINSDILDTFMMADKMLMVVTPEKTSIENLYYFVNNAIFRKIERFFSANKNRSYFDNTLKNKKKLGIVSTRDLIDHLLESSPEKMGLAQELQSFNLYLILNQTRKKHDTQVGFSLASLLLKYLGLKTIYLGSAEYDNHVSQCINDGDLFMKKHSVLRAAREISNISFNLVNDKQIKRQEY